MQIVGHVLINHKTNSIEYIIKIKGLIKIGDEHHKVIDHIRRK
jgi:hypothetical protein